MRSSPGGNLRSVESLRKILDRERQLGFSDRAVIGGVDRFLDAWRQDLTDQISAPPLSGRTYAVLTPAQRREWAAAALRAAPPAGPAHNGGTGQAGSDDGERAAAPSPAPDPGAAGPDASTGGAGPQKASRKRPAEPRSSPPSGGHRLTTPVKELPFITRGAAPRLVRMGVLTLADLVHLFPNRHVDYADVTRICDLELDQETTVMAHVTQSRTLPIGPKPGAARVTVSDGTGLLEATFFRQAYLVQSMRPGVTLALSGRVREWQGKAQMENPEHEIIPRGREGQPLVHAGNLLPVYPATEGLQQRVLRNAARKALETGLPLINEFLPDDIRERQGLPALREAISEMHFPPDVEAHQSARRRLAFDELFLNQLAALRRRVEWRLRRGGVQVPAGAALVNGFLGTLDYELTPDQSAALETVLAEMAGDVPMARLLQGEVGSGKTIVAVTAMLAAAAAGYQAALLAPTEVLAEQHFLSVAGQLGAEPPGMEPDAIREAVLSGAERPVRLALLIGSLPRTVKGRVHDRLAAGEIDLVIGTHALLQEAVEIPRLGLSVVDEQHRFGVEQRAALAARSPRPHLLAMSATPIPRSLALTLYGDLDLSTLRQLPRGRKPIQTRWLRTSDGRHEAYDLIRSEVAAGRQAFIVCPLIDESEQVRTRSAIEEHQLLAEQVFPDLHVGLLHGRMALNEKQEVMDLFRSGEVQVLVATPVIEVGIDIPNATVMMIEGADRFGLSQLHQFRGRVGRGDFASYCLLLSDDPSEDARRRLAIVERASDGFELAEEDLRLRGPGEYLGTRQSGADELKVASLLDFELLTVARQEAARILDVDPDLQAPEHQALSGELDALAQKKPGEFS